MATPTFVNPLNNFRPIEPIDNFALAQGLDMSKSAEPVPTPATPNLPTSTAGMSEADLANLYNSQINAGFNDAQVRSAADAAYGKQASSDWDYLVNLAKQSAPAIDQSYKQFTQPAVEPNTGSFGYPTASVTGTDPAYDYEKMVRDAYGSIGRTGIGEDASNIDQAGFDNWVNALRTGSVNPSELASNFKGSVADYLAANPSDKYSTYVADYLQSTNNPETAGVQQLYQEVLGRDADAGGLGNWYKQFGTEISPEERAQFEQSAKGELDTRVKDLYTDFLGRTADDEGLDYWKKQFGSSIDDSEREQFRQSAATEVNKRFGVTDPATTPTTEGILSGFKYLKDSGINEDKLKKTLGEDVFNTYKSGFSDYAKTGIANVLADKKLSFDEAREQVKFGRDYGYDAQKMADLTGTDKKVFDAVYKNYDDTTNRIVDGVLGAEDVKTDGDKIMRALALQKQFSFTDEDLAKATDFSLDQVKSYLDPVRNFDSDYSKLRADPNLNEDKVKTFLETSMQNPAIKQKLGSQLQPVLDELNKPPREKMLGQIEAQRKALGGEYYQGVFSDPQAMADALERKGVKSLSDLKEKDKFQNLSAQVKYTTSDGRPLTQLDDGTLAFVDGTDEQNVWRRVPKDQAKATYGTYEPYSDGEYSGVAFTPLSEAEQATLTDDGKYQKKIGTVVIDKNTGKELTDTNHVLAHQYSGGGLKKKHNEIVVGFAKDGTPIAMATKKRAGAGAALQDAAPLIAFALPFVLPGIGAALSGMLPGAGVAASGATAAIAPSLLNQALTQGIISGGLTTLGGGQFEEGFLGGAVSPMIGSGISSLLPTGLDANAARAITGAGTGVVKGALEGGNLDDLLQQGILSGAANYGLGEATKGLNLTPQQLNLATGIVAPMLQGKNINPMNLISSLAKTTLQQTTKATP